MERRAFLVSSLKASLLAYLGSVAKGSAASPRGGQAPLRNQDAWENPLSAYLESYRPPRGKVTPERPQTFTYDIVSWSTEKGRRGAANTAIGSLIVTRTGDGENTRFDYRQEAEGGLRLEGFCRCSAEPIPVVRDWECRACPQQAPSSVRELTTCTERGTVTDRRVRLRCGDTETEQVLQGPLLSRFSLLSLPGLAAVMAERRDPVCVLDEPSMIRYEQVFRRDSASAVPAFGPVRSWMQTGPGSLPTHWVTDEEGRPLFVTVFLLSLVLVDIS